MWHEARGACGAGFGRGPRECLGVSTALEVLACVIRGFQTPLLPSHHSLLFAVLLPLHLPSGMLSMRYSEPIIQQYHQVLAPSSHCTAVCEADPNSGFLLMLMLEVNPLHALGHLSGSTVCGTQPEARVALSPRLV